MLRPVIFAGGSGSRLWPLSRVSEPKQFLPLLGDQSQFEATLRLLKTIPSQRPIVVTNENYLDVVLEQIERTRCDYETIFLEPIGKNTAPALASAALYQRKLGEEYPFLALPADHVIQDQEAFRCALELGLGIVEKQKLVTFGVKPTRPETGYGYIEASNPSYPSEIISFKEKPSLELATEYVTTPSFLWNSGIFLFKASQFLEELRLYEPELFSFCAKAVENGTSIGRTFRPESTNWQNVKELSIDTGVMERTKNGWVVPISVGWSDVGAWSEVLELSPKDEDSNVLFGDALAIHSSNCYVRTDSRLVVALGVEGLVVVDTEDALLVTKSEFSQQVRTVTNLLKQRSDETIEHGTTVRRPWGSYKTIEKGAGFLTKLIKVNPGQKLSVQYHHHRSEHWIVVAGTASVTKGENSFVLQKNQSISIEPLEIHSLGNNGHEDLLLIEVQIGSETSEDDIVRIEDRYGRADNHDSGKPQA